VRLETQSPTGGAPVPQNLDMLFDIRLTCESMQLLCSHTLNGEPVMRFILAAMILASFSTNLLAADAPAPAGAEQQIKDRTKEMDAAWNKHDAQAFAAFYATSGTIVTETGDELSGREGIQQALGVSSVRLIKPDVAIVDSDAELKMGDADARKIHVLTVLVNTDGKWLTETTRVIHYKEQ
jgi:hypothetical protein